MSQDKKDQILIACQELIEEGKSVTVRAVIDKVGGSSRDVSPIVKEFKES
nr:DNA-binding protein [Xenococcus sp. MO_188.B8]